MTNPVQVDLETPEADAAEQATPVPGWSDADSDDRTPTTEATLPTVNDWEAREQDRFVEFDDDYR